MSARLEYTSEHRQFREMVHDFVQQTVVPAHEQWEKAGCLDRSLFTEAGKLGLLAFSVPEEFGGPGVDDFRYNAIVVDELQRAGAAAEAMRAVLDATPARLTEMGRLGYERVGEMHDADHNAKVLYAFQILQLLRVALRGWKKHHRMEPRAHHAET